MGRFAAKYTEAQKQAIVEAVLDNGLTHGQAVKQAAAGKLADLPPFTMPVASSYTYTKQEKKRRVGIAARTNPQTPLERLDTFTTRTLNILDHELTRLEKKAGPGKSLTKDDADQMKRLAQVAREVKALGLNVQPVHGGNLRTEAQRTAKAKEDTARKEAETAPTLSDRMMRDMDSEPAPRRPHPLGDHREPETDAPSEGQGHRDEGGEGSAEAGRVLTSDAHPAQLVPA